MYVCHDLPVCACFRHVGQFVFFWLNQETMFSSSLFRCVKYSKFCLVFYEMCVELWCRFQVTAKVWCIFLHLKMYSVQNISTIREISTLLSFFQVLVFTNLCFLCNRPQHFHLQGPQLQWVLWVCVCYVPWMTHSVWKSNWVVMKQTTPFFPSMLLRKGIFVILPGKSKKF